MYWTGKYPQDASSPYWNNHILDGTGLDDGTLSQWLQVLRFPKGMLNNKGPKNRLDQVIWDGFMGKTILGFYRTCRCWCRKVTLRNNILEMFTDGPAEFLFCTINCCDIRYRCYKSVDCKPLFRK
uniref:Variant erythrocyte surface antigen-alpha subunit n=1 Tax=Babesia bovis TaxID=5865 RepID=S6BPF7_BABBO|nr:variant erythrocyte surface antigen- alpha subunit [Babesia bovis]